MSTRGSYAKGVLKRNEILQAALEVFAAQGYDRASVREVGRMVGLSQAGVLHYFSTKEELYIEILRNRDELGDSLEASSDNALRHLFEAVRNNANRPELVRLFVVLSAEAAANNEVARQWFSSRYDKLISELSADIAVRQNAGEVSTSLPASDMAKILIAASDGLQIQWLLNPKEIDMSKELNVIWSSFLI